MQDDDDDRSGEQPKSDRGRAGDHNFPPNKPTKPDANRSRPGSDAQSVRAADQMTDEEWLEALLELNPWARDSPTSEWDSRAFREKKADQLLLRLKQPVETWNNWAEQIAELRPRQSIRAPHRAQLFFSISAIETQILGATLDFRGRDISGDLICRSKQKLNAKFDGCRFLGNTIVSSTQSGRLSFDSCEFHKLALFASTKFELPIFFEGTKFLQGSDFRQCYFAEFVSFRLAEFRRGPRFDATRFGAASTFQKAEFWDDAFFSASTFCGDADFCGTKFYQGAFFTKGPDGDSQNIIATQFKSNCAFDRSSFNERAHFSNAVFSKFASFRSIKSKLAFSLSQAKFTQTPDFTDATFHEPPRLDNCEMPNPINEFQPFQSTADDPRPRDSRFAPALFPIWRVARAGDEHARFRKLRKMAADAKDHENELKFNGYEIAARRFWVDHPYKNPGRFWLGWLYGLTSNYGQSVMRPFALWLVSIFVFWGIIHVATLDHAVIEPGKCHPQFAQATGEAKPPYFGLGTAGQSFTLAFRNALVIERPDPAVARRMYGCLYGVERATLSRSGPVEAAKSSEDEIGGAGPWPVIPLSVTLLSALQSVVSAILLFLLGLALRNMFRMK